MKGRPNQRYPFFRVVATHRFYCPTLSHVPVSDNKNVGFPGPAQTLSAPAFMRAFFPPGCSTPQNYTSKKLKTWISKLLNSSFQFFKSSHAFEKEINVKCTRRRQERTWCLTFQFGMPTSEAPQHYITSQPRERVPKNGSLLLSRSVPVPRAGQ